MEAAQFRTEKTTASTKTATVEKTDKKRADIYIWGIFIFLCLISVVETYSASSREITGANLYSPIVKHIVFLFMGAAIAFSLSQISYQKFIKFIPLFGISTLGLLGYVEMFGESINGAQRQLSIAGITIQPAEMAKLGVVLFIAWIMAKNQMVRGVKNWGVTLSAVIVTISGAFLFKQVLTNTLLLMCICFFMMLICVSQWQKFLIVIAIYGAFGAAFALYHFGDKEEDAANV